MARAGLAGVAVHPPPPIAVCSAPPSPPTSHSSAAPPPPSAGRPPAVAPVSHLSTFAAEMFVWLWFAPATVVAPPSSSSSSAAPRRSTDTAISKLQFAPTPRFVGFCHDVLSTTQVSHSVVLLALLFIARLKQKNQIHGAPGSEFRLAVTGLMLANKVLDDNIRIARTEK
ncbi:hypothetical protein JCM10212_006216 [Sporobolomyces blumeae]